MPNIKNSQQNRPNADFPIWSIFYHIPHTRITISSYISYQISPYKKKKNISTLPHSNLHHTLKQENSHFHTHHLQTLQHHTSQLCKNVANRVQNQACLCYAEVSHIFAIRLQLQSCKVPQQN